MQQISTQLFESLCGKAKLYVESDMPVGAIHDFLFYLKGDMIERMIKAHQDEMEIAKQNMKSCEE